MKTTDEIPWKIWVAKECPGCGLKGEGRYRLIAAGRECPRCGDIMKQVGEPFPVEGSDL